MNSRYRSSNSNKTSAINIVNFISRSFKCKLVNWGTIFMVNSFPIPMIHLSSFFIVSSFLMKKKSYSFHSLIAHKRTTCLMINKYRIWYRICIYLCISLFLNTSTSSTKSFLLKFTSLYADNDRIASQRPLETADWISHLST